MWCFRKEKDEDEKENEEDDVEIRAARQLFFDQPMERRR